MKKIITAVLACLFMAVSCNLMDDVYTVTNLNEFVTVSGETLVNDAGLELSVTEDLTDKGWKNDGKRLFVQYDVLNRNLDISLKAYTAAIIQAPVHYDQSGDIEVKDPVTIIDANISRTGYLNVVVSFYKKTETDCPHDITLACEDDGSRLSFYLTHEGNKENPSEMDMGSLKEVSRAYCFPLEGIIPSDAVREVFLRADILVSDENGNYTVVRKNAALYTSSLGF